MQKLFSIRGPNLQFGTFLNYVTRAPEATCFLLHFSHGVHTTPHSSLDEHNARPFTDPNERESTHDTCYGDDPLEIPHRVVARRRRLHLGRGGVGRRRCGHVRHVRLDGDVHLLGPMERVGEPIKANCLQEYPPPEYLTKKTEYNALNLI